MVPVASECRHGRNIHMRSINVQFCSVQLKRKELPINRRKTPTLIHIEQIRRSITILLGFIWHNCQNGPISYYSLGSKQIPASINNQLEWIDWVARWIEQNCPSQYTLYVIVPTLHAQQTLNAFNTRLIHSRLHLHMCAHVCLKQVQQNEESKHWAKFSTTLIIIRESISIPRANVHTCSNHTSESTAYRNCYGLLFNILLFPWLSIIHSLFCSYSLPFPGYLHVVV